MPRRPQGPSPDALPSMNGTLSLGRPRVVGPATLAARSPRSDSRFVPRGRHPAVLRVGVPPPPRAAVRARLRSDRQLGDDFRRLSQCVAPPYTDLLRHESGCTLLASEIHGGPDEAGRLVGLVRKHALTGLGAMFVLVMLFASRVITGSDPTSQLFGAVFLILLALALPLPMAALARRIVTPASELEAARHRTLHLYNRARLDALLDPITGLGNHRAFQEELNRQIAQAQAEEQLLALVMIDLDDLKCVNDEQGHARGDELLGLMGRLV